MKVRAGEAGIGAVPLEAVLCTDELERRPWRQPDHAAENRALARIGDALARSPVAILQALADTVVEVTGSDSAGLSLLTRIEGQLRFYWPAIAGIWKPHVGGGTPRDFGPCGDVLDRHMPLLFRHPERRYPYLRPVMPPAVECLLVPFECRGKNVGTIWAMMHDERRGFDREDLRLLVALGRFASSAYSALTGRGIAGNLRAPAAEAPSALRGSLASEVTLSPRERQVVWLLALGLSYDQAARELAVTAKTVETYRARAARKLGVKDRAGLVRFALRAGMLQAGQPAD